MARKERTEHEKLIATAKGRASICSAVEAALIPLGVKVTIEKLAPDEISFRAEKGRYYVVSWFERYSKVRAFLGHWNTESRDKATGERVETRYPRAFGYVIGGTINEFHYSKATTCEDTLEAYVLSLVRGFEALEKAGLLA